VNQGVCVGIVWRTIKFEARDEIRKFFFFFLKKKKGALNVRVKSEGLYMPYRQQSNNWRVSIRNSDLNSITTNDV
jgi:hypothetical protein